MADDWKVGDLGVSVPRPKVLPAGAYLARGKKGLPKGMIYIIERVELWNGIVGLGVSVASPHRTGLWHHAAFRKVTPEEADDFDRETIELMNRKPVGEVA